MEGLRSQLRAARDEASQHAASAGDQVQALRKQLEDAKQALQDAKRKHELEVQEEQARGRNALQEQASAHAAAMD